VDVQINVVPNMEMKIKAEWLEIFYIGHSEETLDPSVLLVDSHKRSDETSLLLYMSHEERGSKIFSQLKYDFNVTYGVRDVDDLLDDFIICNHQKKQKSQWL
jgi:hypothetical protein